MRRMAGLAALALVATACGGPAGGGRDEQTLTVLAAASLTEPFTDSRAASRPSTPASTW